MSFSSSTRTALIPSLVRVGYPAAGLMVSYEVRACENIQSTTSRTILSASFRKPDFGAASNCFGIFFGASASVSWSSSVCCELALAEFLDCCRVLIEISDCYLTNKFLFFGVHRCQVIRELFGRSGQDLLGTKVHHCQHASIQVNCATKGFQQICTSPTFT